MTETSKHRPIRIDLNQFKLHIDLKKRIELTLHFDSPSRRFYLSVIAFVVNEMKRLGKITSIPLEKNHDLLALLNDTVGGSAGASDVENLQYRIYRKWKNALPNLEEAPLFKVLGRKKQYDEGVGKTYPFTDTEKDNWANLFEYIGSEKNVRLKFALDKIGADLDDVDIIYEDSVNGDAWDRFLLSLKREVEKVPEAKPVQPISEAPEPPVAPPREESRDLLQSRYHWIALIAVVVTIVGAATWGIWELAFRPAQANKASIERMAFPLPDVPSIAVLPFVNMSDDKSQEYFSDGLTEDLITDLSKISGLFVIARDSTSAYKGKPVKIRQVAEDLGVRYVLEGSVRRAGDEVRINAQLVDATTGQHLWAERYDGSMRDVFSLQDNINQKIVAALAVNLTAGEKELLTQKGTQDPVAYEEFLKGREHYRRFTKEDFAKAEACFKRAIEMDPKFSRAKGSFALFYHDMASLGMSSALNMSYPIARLRARALLVEAMKEPTSTAYQAGSLMDTYLRQWDLAISEIEKALALGPNDPACHLVACRVLSLSGRPADGIEHAKIAMRLDPLNPARYLLWLGIAYFCAGEWEKAVTATENALKLNPLLFTTALIQAAANARLGRDEEAKVAAQFYRRAAPPGTVFTPRGFMQGWPFKNRDAADSFEEGLKKSGLFDEGPGYIHVSKKDQITGEDLKTFFFPSKFIGFTGDGTQFSQEVSKDGTLTLRAPYVPGGVDTDGKSWLEGDVIWVKIPKLYGDLASCRTFFKNPKGTPQGKDEYVYCNDIGMNTFSFAQ